MTSEQLNLSNKLGFKPELILAVARVAHTITQAWLQGIGEMSRPPWPVGKGSIVNCVLHVLRYPDSTPEELHRYWLQQMQSEGWCYGPLLDMDVLENPFLRPYYMLSPEQRGKQIMFRAAVLKAYDYMKREPILTDGLPTQN